MIKAWKVFKDGNTKTISKETILESSSNDVTFSVKEYPLFSEIPFKEFYTFRKEDEWVVRIIKI